MEHSFDIEFAKEYGLAAAILYRHIQFWIAKNKANEKNCKDGRTWTYNSVKAFNKLFPYIGHGQIRGALKLLVDRKVLLRNNYNKRNGDCTTWYAFVDEKAALEGFPTHLLKSQRVEKSGNSRAQDRPETPFAKITKPLLKSQSLCENNNALPDTQSNPYTTTQINNNKVEKNPYEILELDCEIKRQANFLSEQLGNIFSPQGRSKQTFSNIIRYFVSNAQASRGNLKWFKEAVEWARIARIEGRKAGGKALFVQTVKERTGYGSNPKLLPSKSQEDSRARASPAA